MKEYVKLGAAIHASVESVEVIELVLVRKVNDDELARTWVRLLAQKLVH